MRLEILLEGYLGGKLRMEDTRYLSHIRGKHEEENKERISR